MKQYAARPWAFLLSLAMLLSIAACGGDGGVTAATMRLRRAEGMVSVSNCNGKTVPPLNNLGLYSGYGVGTRSASYAWIDLDEVKLTKLDQNSEISIGQEGKKLDIELKSGSLFFNVTEPLGDDETMNIRTSTMLVGIRGTSGWVEANDGLSRVYLLTGKVECSAEGQTVQVNAGEFAELTADGELTVKEFTDENIPAFVREEVDDGPEETPGPGSSDAPEPSQTQEISLIPQGTLVTSGDIGENLAWALYSDGTMVISGTGPMEDFAYQSAPWWENRDSMTGILIEDGVTSIGDYAFDDCENLAAVSIPAGFVRIGRCAFNACSKLETVSFRGNGNDALIDQFAFWNCGGLTSIYLPEGVARIEHRAFCWCNRLTDIGFPASLTSISGEAFLNCGWIRNVYYAGSEEDWSKISGHQNHHLSDAEFHYNYTEN